MYGYEDYSCSTLGGRITSARPEDYSQTGPTTMDDMIYYTIEVIDVKGYIEYVENPRY